MCPAAEIGPVADRALRWLSAFYDPLWGLAREHERTTAILVVLALSDAGHPLTPQAAAYWASAAGWEPAHAQDLADIVQSLRAGDRPPLAPGVRLPAGLIA